MKLVDAYCSEQAPELLYRLLQEREPHVNISHQSMPVWEQHCAYFNSHPHPHWYLMVVEGKHVGAIYLSKRREVGIFVLKEFRGKGYGTRALKLLRELHPGKVLANINPSNSQSMEFFARRGFKALQVTYVA